MSLKYSPFQSGKLWGAGVGGGGGTGVTDPIVFAIGRVAVLPFTRATVFEIQPCRLLMQQITHQLSAAFRPTRLNVAPWRACPMSEKFVPGPLRTLAVLTVMVACMVVDCPAAGSSGQTTTTSASSRPAAARTIGGLMVVLRYPFLLTALAYKKMIPHFWWARQGNFGAHASLRLRSRCSPGFAIRAIRRFARYNQRNETGGADGATGETAQARQGTPRGTGDGRGYARAPALRPVRHLLVLLPYQHRRPPPRVDRRAGDREPLPHLWRMCRALSTGGPSI
jgi:hypothetical protein